MIAIVDYGMGNIHSVQKVVESFGVKSFIANEASELINAEKVILPGVGAFADAMNELEKRNLKSAIAESIKNKKPFLGICLGLQLLFDQSFEAAGLKGLGIISGVVSRFNNIGNLKIPHIGWNQIHKTKSQCPLLNNIPSGAYVYFCHSYYVVPEDKDVISATTDYGTDFASVISKENIFGMQFHPEKSQDIGLKILKNFIEL